MQDELNNFDRNNIWDLVSKPKDCSVIDTKWIFRNMLDESDIVTRNKSRLIV